MVNASLNRQLNESIRVLNERLRLQLVAIQQFLVHWDANYASLIATAPDDETIDDGRNDTPYRTVGELRQWLKMVRAIASLSSYRDAADNIPLQTAINEIMAGVDVPVVLAKFTVRTGLF